MKLLKLAPLVPTVMVLAKRLAPLLTITLARSVPVRPMVRVALLQTEPTSLITAVDKPVINALPLVSVLPLRIANEPALVMTPATNASLFCSSEYVPVFARLRLPAIRSTLLVSQRVPAMLKFALKVLLLESLIQRLLTPSYKLALNVPRLATNTVVPRLVAGPLTTSEPLLTSNCAVFVIKSAPTLVT